MLSAAGGSVGIRCGCGGAVSSGASAGLLIDRDTERPDGPRDVLDDLLSQVLEAEAGKVADAVADTAAHADATRVGQGLEPCSHVHAVTEDVAVLDHDVADIDADAEQHPARLRQLVVGRGDLPLDLYGTADGIDDASELSEHAVACGIGNPAVEADDQLVGDRPMRRQRGESRLLVERHQAAVAFDIGCEDGDQPAIEGRCFHADEPNPLPVSSDAGAAAALYQSTVLRHRSAPTRP